MKYLLFFLPVLLFGCGQKNGENKNTSYADDVKLEQYMIAGQELYVQSCSNCHQANGQGLAALYPPLNPSDYIDDNLEKVVCVIKNGLEGEIVVNGEKYNQLMPANTHLTDLEIAEISTYLYNSWGRDKGLIDVKQVSKILNNCKK